MKKDILICIGLYLPGVNGGGPIRSISNLVDKIGDEYNIYIFTSDRDLGDVKSYANINVDKWNKVDKANVFYCSPKNMKFNTIKSILEHKEYKSIYLNSFFSTFTIKMILYLKLSKNKSKIILAPRGEFSKSALDIKKLKKLVYINLFKNLFNSKQIKWHATSNHEKSDIINIIKNADCKVISNIGNRNTKGIKDIGKEKGSIRIAYVSRIAKIKNLDTAIDILARVNGNVIYDIYGPLEDKEYWEICKSKMDNLPENIQISYKGKVNNNQIFNILSEYHAFLLPTKGENFGHAIYEAISSGCIPIISNRTPWINLQKNNVGWDIDLNNINEFSTIIQTCIDMDNEKYREIRNNIKKYIETVNSNDKSVIKMKQLIN